MSRALDLPDPFAFDVHVLEYARLRSTDDAAALLARHVHQRTAGPDGGLRAHGAMKDGGGRLPIRRYVDHVVFSEPVRGNTARAWVDPSVRRVGEERGDLLARAGIDVPGVRLIQRASR